MHRNPIISQKTCQKLFSGIEITETQRKAQQKWLDLIENKQLEKEKENYPIFQNTILRDLLGFPEEEIEKAYEQKNVEFVFKDSQDDWAVLFEAKGMETSDLFAVQHRKKANQKTPIKQTFDNLTRFEFIKYGVCTNYRKFVLMDYNLKFSAFQEFDFLSTKKDDEKLKEFIGIFSYESLVINKDISKFKSISDNADEELTTEFYKLFHETRLMLIKAFKEKDEISEQEALLYSQIFLERILFLFFALDNGLIDDSKLFTNRILAQLKLNQCTSSSRKIFDDINLLFEALDKGDKFLNIHGFGGELFDGKIPSKVYFLDFQTKLFFANEIMNSKLSKELPLKGDAEKIWEQTGNNVSPIIRNLLIMDSRDFNSEINVTILGHILEQSLDDLSQYQKSGELKRKIDGVYYTPATLTDYICRNTIIPYLSKNNTNDVEELILEYQDNISELEEKIDKLRIIDPACGSGAFLINAATILLEINTIIHVIKNQDQLASGTLDDWQQEQEVSKIIKNNIFGADINRTSVQITKLSLFLIMAKKGETLSNLSENIITGNSLIDDKSVDPQAFEWKEKFPEIFSDGGFDIVVGNPPWQIVKPDVDEFFSSLQKMKFLLLSDPKTKHIPFSKLTKNKKNFFVNKCLEDNKIKSDYERYIKYYKTLMEYFLNIKNYEYQISEIDGKKIRGIDLNLYKLFLEKSYLILKNNGVFGMVLPNGILSDLGTKRLRELLLDSCQILELCGFINSKPIFYAVHRQFKFCTILLQKSITNKNFLAKFRQTDDMSLSKFHSTAIEYDKNIISKLSPTASLITEILDKTTLEIFTKLTKFPLLGDQNHHKFRASRELDMTDDSGFFHTSDIGTRLFEGKMIYQFSDSFQDPTYWVDTKEIKDELIRREIYRNRKATKNLPNYKPITYNEDYRLVWRTITNSIDKRTLIATILPPNIVLGNSLNFLWPHYFNTDKNEYTKLYSHEETLFLCGLFNSFVVDYLLRHRVGTNLRVYIILEIPIPKFDKNDILHKKIITNSSKLICTTDDFDDLRKTVGIPDFETDDNKRIILQAQINACVAKIYGLNQSDLEHILEIFTIEDPKLKELTMDEFVLL